MTFTCTLSNQVWMYEGTWLDSEHSSDFIRNLVQLSFEKKIYHITTGTICMHVFLSFPTNPSYICTYSGSMGASWFKFLKQTSKTGTDCFSLVEATTHTNTDQYHFPVFHFMTNTSSAASHTWLSTPFCHLAFELIFSSHATTDRNASVHFHFLILHLSTKWQHDYLLPPNIALSLSLTHFTE